MFISSLQQLLSCIYHDGKLSCQKFDNIRVSKKNKSHQFITLPNEYLVECLRILHRIGLTDKINIDDDKIVLEFKISLPLFHPNRNVPLTKNTNDVKISPLEG